MDKKLWNIDHCYRRRYTKSDGTDALDVEMIHIATIRATENEIEELNNMDWNKPTLENEYGEMFRPLNATEVKEDYDTVEKLKQIIQSEWAIEILQWEVRK